MVPWLRRVWRSFGPGRHGRTRPRGRRPLTFELLEGRDLPSVTVTELPTPTAGSKPAWITSGPDGALWFTEFAKGQVGRITTAGAVTEYALPGPNSRPEGIASGPDGALWFTEFGAAQVGRITTAGAVTEYALLRTGTQPYGIA